MKGCLRVGLPVLLAAVVWPHSTLLTAAEPTGNDVVVRVVDRPGTGAKNNYYAGNRTPLLPSPFLKLPPGAVKPMGWLHKQLRLQADGFHGHLTEISRFLEKEGNAWLHPDSGKHGWEEPVYWLKGYGNCAYVLGDAAMLAETRIWIEGILGSQKPDGWFGPDTGRGGVATRLKGREDLWPNMIALFCLQDYYEYSGDRRVPDLMTKYMRYLNGVPEERFLVGYWPKMRAADLLFSIYWLYNRTGDAFLLELSRKVHRNTARWDEDVINWHNVNMAQAFGGPTTYYLQTGDARHLEASERNWRRMREMYGQVPGGMFGGDENCRPGYTGPRQAVETCGMVEMMLSHETLLQITGNPVWADRCEDVAFNSLPASTTADMKALRYLTAPNMVLSDRHSKSPGLQNGGPMLLMNPHIHRCCQHNMGHGWPYFVEHLWFATADNGLAAAIYGPGEVTAKVGNGATVTIAEMTRYPFDEKITLVVSARESARFPLYLRVPGWCARPQLSVNGDPAPVQSRPRSYVVVEREWNDGDTVEWVLPMVVSVRKWTANLDSVSVDRGPLTYSLKIGEKYVREGGSEEWPAWEILPTTDWNYGLDLAGDDPADRFEFVRKEWPATDMPFVADDVPVLLRAKGRKIPQWQLDSGVGLVGKLQKSPAFTEEPLEPVTLIPMGAARLRISSFPTVSNDPEAVRWTLPPPPMASHVHSGDTVEALWDGKVPRNSGDHEVPRFTWWDHVGTKEWVQYNLGEASTVSFAEIYWFDDTGVGRCRTPRSWRLFYRSGNDWKPVTGADGYGVEKDRFNRVTFDPVRTDALRVEVQLRPEVSGGVLEMRVGTQ